jgi:hydroxypyruvate reductase
VTDKPHVLIHSAWYEPAMRRLDELAVTHHLYEAGDEKAFLAEFGPKCTVIGTMHYCPASLMDAVPDLKLILNFGVGYDGVDVAEATRRGVKVVNTPAVLNDCVADMALSLTLGARRHLVQADRYARAGRWPVEGDYPYTLNVHSTKVGILGMGRIGMEIADRCRAFKMDISYHQRTKRDDVPYTYYSDLVAMARDVDILIAIIPGGDATRGLVSEAVIEALGPTGLLVNVARGTVVDNDALARCLKDGRLGAAAVDVYPDEPNIPPALLEITENLTLTPHMASGTHYTRNAMGMVLYDNLKAMIDGKPLLTPVN